MFLGLNQYFVASDVGHGRMQWYAFYKQPLSSPDPPAGNYVFCMSYDFNWNFNVLKCFRQEEAAARIVS